MSSQQLFQDTHPKAEAFLIQHLQTLSPADKWRMVRELNASVRHLMWTGLQARMPHADEAALQREWAVLLLGEEMAKRIAPSDIAERTTHMPVPEPLDVTLRVTQVLGDLDIPYFITGSLASALYGVARTTQDADIVADLKEEHVERLVAALQDEFYIDEEAVRKAVRERRSFNLIHLATMFKVDIFVCRAEGFDRSRLSRRVALVVGPDPKAKAKTYFATPEDAVLAKLDGNEKGGRISDRQWQDVLGMLKVSGQRLDVEYMRVWADRLGVADLLERALADAR